MSRPRRHGDEFLAPMGRVLRVDHLRKQKLGERLALRKDGPFLDRGPENLHVLGPTHRYLVVRILGAGVNRLHHDENVLELRTDPSWRERQRAGFLEHDGDDVVPDVALPEQLLTVVRREGKHC